MLEKVKLGEQIDGFWEGLATHKEAIEFIKRHRIWTGFMKHGWIAKLVIIVGVLFSLVLFSIVLELISGFFDSGSDLIENTSSMLGELKELLFLEGGFKYIGLVVVEALVFHASIRTLNILTNDYMTPEYQDFKHAIKRMISVAFQCWVRELIFVGLISIPFAILGWQNFKFIPIFLVHSYYFGFAFMDNYAEQFGLEIKESFRVNYMHIGATLAVGLVAMVLFKIPIVGILAASLLGATTATLYLYKNNIFHEEIQRLFYEDRLELEKQKELIELKK